VVPHPVFRHIQSLSYILGREQRVPVLQSSAKNSLRSLGLNGSDNSALIAGRD
jgi:hypothetical protein